MGRNKKTWKRVLNKWINIEDTLTFFLGGWGSCLSNRWFSVVSLCYWNTLSFSKYLEVLDIKLEVYTSNQYHKQQNAILRSQYEKNTTPFIIYD